MINNLITNKVASIYNNIFAEQNSNNENIQHQSHLPVETWHNIIKYCDVKTTSTLSMLCKFHYVMVTPLLHRKILQFNYQQKVPRNSSIYSIDSYKNFIAPIIENINIEIKHEIDYFLDKNKKNPDIKQLFSEFVFKKMESIITKNHTATALEIDLFQGIDKFNTNPQSNHCAITLKKSKNIIYICKLSFPLAIEVVTKIDFLPEDQSITSIQFTPENNLLVVAESTHEEGDKYFAYNRRRTLKEIYKVVTTSHLFLFSLNLNSNNIDLEQLWKCKIEDIEIHGKPIIIPHSNDKKLILITGRFPKYPLLLTIKDTSFDMKKFTLFGKTLKNKTLFSYNEEVGNFIFSSNGLELAVIFADHPLKFTGVESRLHMFSRNSIQHIFIEKQLPKNNYDLVASFATNKDIYYPFKFNKSGNICVFTTQFSGDLVMLNKIDGEWYVAMQLVHCNYRDLELSLDEKKIFATRYHFNMSKKNKNNIKRYLDVIPIEDKILKSKQSPVCIQEYKTKLQPKYENYYTLYEDINFDMLMMHPSSLVVFIKDKKEEGEEGEEGIVKIIIPQDDEDNKPVREKISYYVDKLKGLILRENASDTK